MASTTSSPARTDTAPCCAPIASATISPTEAAEAASIFKALADPARVQIVNILATADEPVCVCDITPHIGLSQPTVSFHLKKLLTAGLLEREQRGKWAYYALRSGALAEVAGALDPKGTHHD